ncbi:unnamed protein product [Rotaria sordida]|uniref:Uncharacterized protein n=1 Tax=Rotaria sordida TaxID=392033 RepID=A0A818RFX6_9BILA|nr:unnamed protein product [Rotaria sordida]CAF3653595.1 unnamed protein product [Rotaria sordida]
MILINNSLLSTTTITTTSVDLYLNSTVEINKTSSFSIILTIIILSCLSISGWIFMSYALFGRSEAYRAKPEDQFGSSDPTNRSAGNDFFFDFD